jgi:hypothetical protein
LGQVEGLAVFFDDAAEGNISIHGCLPSYSGLIGSTKARKRLCFEFTSHGGS